MSNKHIPENITIEFIGPKTHVQMSFKINFEEDIRKNVFHVAIAAFILRTDQITPDLIKSVFDNLSQIEKQFLQTIRKAMIDKIINENKTHIVFRLNVVYKNQCLQYPVITPLPHYIPLLVE